MSVSMCLFVCLSACIHHEPHVRNSPNFLCMLLEDRSSSGGVIICYVLPILWTTSRFPIMGPTAA